MTFKELLKEFNQKDVDAMTYSAALLNVLSGMFRWDGLPDTVRPEFIEIYLRLYGSCAICPDKDGNIIAATVNRGGAPDVYGLGTTPIIATRNGYTETYNEVVNDVMYGDNGRRGVIIYNNNTKTPDSLIRIFTNLLSEAVTSFYQNVIHSRYNPVFVANNDIVKRAIESAMGDIIAGKPVVIVADNILTEIETGSKTLETVTITDVDKQEKIQFISKTIDDLLRWFLTIYGQAVQGNGKLAQQTVDEVNGTTSSSFIVPEIAWRCRNNAAELINKTFGFNCSVSYNKPWAVEVENYTEDKENEEITDEENNDDANEENNDDANEENNEGEKDNV